ncbi:MAG TPA: hypothetical protein VH134_13340 [Candidatus Dormibacteraeota bacterium]|jgi:photosystem II stability/assembly factor-like uncharacterized protein|nr:hypothetical protein [Candidatus Dormibacteraeota bacterium]
MADHDRLERGLREHLDQALPLAPGAADRVVAAVRARTAGRRRRSPLPVLAGLATGAVLAGVLGAALWSRATAPPPAVPAPGVSALLGGPADPSAGGGLIVDDVAFGTALRGWVVGTRCDAAGACVLAVRGTADGGRTWSPAATVHADAPAAGGGARIAFTGDRTGFVADHGLWASTDGGASWHPTGLADVIGVAPVGASVWALESCATAAPCPVRLQTSADGGRTWSAATAVAGLAGPRATMVRVSATDAFVAAAAATPSGSRLAATHDGGRSWESLPDPCAPGLLAAPAAIAALEPTELWAACEAPAPAADRAVYRSRDGGRHWELRGDTTTPGGGALGSRGHLSALALAPRGAALLALDGGPLLRSPDGAAWTAVLDGGALRLDMVDPEHGWLVTGAGTVLRTADGGRTWR